MSWLDDVLSGKGTPWGAGPNLGGQANADVTTAEGNANGLTTPTLAPVTASTSAPTAMNGVTTDAGNTAAQKAQLAALSQLAANGGRSAASDANVASIQQAANANAQGQRGAIMQGAAARGMSGGGSSLLAELTGSQADTNNANAQDLGVEANEANTALGAGQGAASIGSNLENQQFGEGAAKASAADAINKFNAGQTQQANMYNSNLGQEEYQDQANKVGLQNNASLAGAGFLNQQAGAKTAANGNMFGSLVGGGATLGAAGIKAAGSSGAGDTGAEDAADTAEVAEAHGGLIPGKATVPGDSYLNDKVHIIGSPGEVMVPRTVAKSGNPAKIADFVMNPPKATPIPGTSQDKDHEAMLAALAHLGRR